MILTTTTTTTTMKSLLSSSSPFSSSSVSTTTSTFDPTMCTSRSATADCLSGVFRRLLCSTSLPTHPSDHFTEASSVEEFDADHKDHQHHFKPRPRENTPGPGLMARLMGLDSMPDFSSIHPQKSPNSISRSRSMNSADCSVLDNNQVQGQHRRVKTSISFREMPTFLEQENDEYLVLSFENLGGNKELNRKERKCEMGFGELKQRRPEKCRNKENRTKKEDQETKINRRLSDNASHKIDNNCSRVQDLTNNSPLQRLKPMNQKEEESSDRATLRRRRRKKKKKTSRGSAIQKLEAECSSSEDSSPVSVLDFGQFTIDPQVPSDEYSRSADSNSRRKLSPELEKYERSSPRSDCNLIGNDHKTEAVEGKCLKPTKQDSHSTESYMDLWGSVCRLAEEDMMMESNWSYTKTSKIEDFGDMCEDLGVQILDQLFQELVADQVAGHELVKSSNM